MEYRAPEYDYEQEPEYENPKRNSETLLKIAISILLVVLIAISFLYYKSVVKSKAERVAIQTEFDTLQVQAQKLIVNLDEIKFDNDTLNRHLLEERGRADSLMTRLKQERNMSVTKLRKYERELSTLRTAMQGFVRQIDSLDRLNKKLVAENIKQKKDISELRLKTDMAEETAQELSLKVKRGSQVKISKLTVRALNKQNKDARNAKQTKTMVVYFDLVANELATPGDRRVYVRIISPEGYEMQETQGSTFTFEGQRTPFSAARTVDYQGENLPVSVHYESAGFTAGKYTIYVYMDDAMVGTTTTILK